MNLNLFDKKRNNNNNFINKFIEELKNALKNINEKENILDEYNLYEKKKLILDNNSRKGNDLVWVMDKDSVCISEDGDGGPISINEINLPDNAKIGDVYEKIDGKYIYNLDITLKLKEIITKN